MSTLAYESLQELGKALYKHKQLIKRAEEAKTAMAASGIDALLSSGKFRTGKLAVKKVMQSLDKNKQNNNPVVMRNVQGN